MAITYGSLFPTSDRIKIDMSDKIYRLTPRATPFFALLSNVAKETCHQIHFKWQESEFFLLREIKMGDADVESKDAGPPVVFVLNIANAEDFRAFETAASTTNTNIVVDLENATGHISYCYCRPVGATTYPIDKTNMQVTLEEYGNNGTSIADEDDVQVSVYTSERSATDRTEYRFGGIQQGSGAPEESRQKVTIMDAATQIFKTSMSVTGSLQATELFGGPELSRLHLRKGLEHNLDIERALIFAGRGDSEGLGATFPTEYAPTTHLTGLGVGIAEDSNYRGFIRSKTAGDSAGPVAAWTIDIDAGSVDYDNFSDRLDTILADVFEVNPASETRVMYCSKNWMMAFSKAARVDNFIRTEMARKEYGIKLTRYKSQAGDVDLVYHPLLRGKYQDYAIVCDLSLMRLRPLRGRDTVLETNIQLNDTDGRKDQYKTEIGFQVINEPAHAILYLDRS